jgi:PKD repeat protein
MTHKLLPVIFFLLFSAAADAQINGSDTMCSGYRYTFTAAIAGADSFAWSFPSGWAVISGNGTSSIQVLCTQNIGQVCVEGYDTGGAFITQFCHTVYWGAGSEGWNVQYTPGTCACDPVTAYISSTGTGGGCAGCGNGTLSPNLVFAMYTAPWPNGSYVCQVGTPFLPPYATFATYYIYYVDITFGIYNAILIDGGLCSGAVDHILSVSPCVMHMIVFASDYTPCLGDTVDLVFDPNVVPLNISTVSWSVNQGSATYITPTNLYSVSCIVNSAGVIQIHIDGININGCLYDGGVDLNVSNCAAQVTGDSIVCAGYTYNYTANIPGAVTYNWTLPSGWYEVTGQGTSSISAACNVSDGDICVEGFDANSNSVGTQCITTQWGGGGAQGWDVLPPMAVYCLGQSLPSVTPYIYSNGTGSGACPPGCGNGTPGTDQLFALYDNSVPYRKFMGVVDGTHLINLPAIPNVSYYVYFVDTTMGADFPDAVIISGGCGSASINNVITVYEAIPATPTFTQVPDPACIGDTVLITQTGVSVNTLWSALSGLTIIGNPSPEEILVVINSTPPDIYYEGVSLPGACFTSGTYEVNTSCTLPYISFTATMNPICPGTCTGFTNNSFFATSYEWSFPGGSPSSSTASSPSNICYNAPGSYDVMLIATNSSGSDTLLMTNYIVVQNYPPSQSILQNGDTLVASQGFASYQWYYNTAIIPGATDYTYVASQDGDYNLISVDSNGCEVEAVLFNVFLGVQSLPDGIFLSVHPNPANEMLFVETALQASPATLEIFNVTGEKIFERKYQRLSAETAIEVRAMLPGIYSLSVKCRDGKTMRIRFVRQ